MQPKGGAVYFGSQLRGRLFVLVGEARQEESEVPGHTPSIVRKLRDMIAVHDLHFLCSIPGHDTLTHAEFSLLL